MLKTITKEELELLPIVEFEGDIHVINTLEEAAAAVQDIRAAHTIIGFDTETKPSFQKGVKHRVSLVQLSVGDTVYLFRLKKMGAMGFELSDLLSDSNCIKVGLAAFDDFKGLTVWNPDLKPNGVVDIQHLVKNFGIEDMSLAKIYAILFGMKISKRQRLTNWDAETLNEKQCKYAAFDAVACVDIYTRLLSLGGRIIAKGEH